MPTLDQINAVRASAGAAPLPASYKPGTPPPAPAQTFAEKYGWNKPSEPAPEEGLVSTLLQPKVGVKQAAQNLPSTLGQEAIGGAKTNLGTVTHAIDTTIKNVTSPLSGLFETIKNNLPDSVHQQISNLAAQHPDIANFAKTLYGATTEPAKTAINQIEDMTGREPGTLTTPKNTAQKSGAVVNDIAQLLAGGAEGAEPLAEKLSASGAEKELQSLAEATSGIADKQARISSLEQTGMLDKNGNPIGGTKQTLLGGIKQEHIATDLARAKDVQGIVKVGASPVENLTNLNKSISEISEQQVAPALEKAGSTMPISEKTPGWNTTVQKLADIPKPDLITADPVLDKTYDLVRNRMIEQIKSQPPTVKGLWDARKAFDQVVRDQFGDVAFDSEKNTAIKRGISDMRRMVNTIIGERVPEYKPLMDKLSNLFDARYNIAEQYQNLVNKGGIKAFETLNPKKAMALKWGLGLVGLGAADKIVKSTTGIGF